MRRKVNAPSKQLNSAAAGITEAARRDAYHTETPRSHGGTLEQYKNVVFLSLNETGAFISTTAQILADKQSDDS